MFSRLTPLVLALAAFFFAAACKKDEPKSTRWEDAAAALETAPASSAPKLPTGTFNKFFPKDGDGYTRTFTADKEGYAEAKFQKGTDTITLTVADSDQNPQAKEKFKDATEKLDGFPVTTLGNNQTSVLVKDRYLVKASSKTVDHEARKAILAKFDLKGLAQ